jgi:hypothetical protein
MPRRHIQHRTGYKGWSVEDGDSLSGPNDEESLSLLRMLSLQPEFVRRATHRSAYLKNIMALLYGDIEERYRLKYLAAIHHGNRLNTLVSYFRDFPDSAARSSWTEDEILKLWRMGDSDSLRALVSIVRYRVNPRPVRDRMRNAMQEAKVAIYQRVYPHLSAQYGVIKDWIRDRRNERPGVSRVELWRQWSSRDISMRDIIVDEEDFFRLANTNPKYRHYTPAYIARCYLRKRLKLPDRLVSR